MNCSDGIKLPAHKAILANASDYFAAQLYGTWAEVRNAHAEIEAEYSSYVMQMVLTHIYTGSFEPKALDKHAEELLNASTRYLLDSFKQICEGHLVETLAVENVTERMQMAARFGCASLLKESLVFARSNLQQLFWHPLFRSLEAQHPELRALMDRAGSGESVGAADCDSFHQVMRSLANAESRAGRAGKRGA